MPTPVALRGDPILRRLPHPAVAAEIGVLAGTLSRYLLSRHADLKLIMVDSWRPASKQSDAYKATNDPCALSSPGAMGRARESCERKIGQYRDRVILLPVMSESAATWVRYQALDLVFLDGDHSYEGVAADIGAWLPKVKPGGFIGGHDYDHPDPRFKFGVKLAVDEFAAARGLNVELDDDTTWFCRLPA